MNRKAQLLKALGFEYSRRLDAYVMRFVGHRVGPVVRVRSGQPTPAGSHARYTYAVYRVR